MRKRGMSFQFAETGPNKGDTGFDPPKLHKLPGKLKKIGDVDDLESGDPTRLMPRLRQIHKMGEVKRRSRLREGMTRGALIGGTVGGLGGLGTVALMSGGLRPIRTGLLGAGLGALGGAGAGSMVGGIREEMKAKKRRAEKEKRAYTLQGHKDFQGINVAIENRRGSVRKGKDSDGHEWRTKMKHPYGYIVGTKGADDEPVDAYVGPHDEAQDAFVVHQHKDTGKGYDEDKVMLGFRNKKEAKEAYLEHYDDPKFLGPVSRVSMDRFKQLVASKKKLVKISHASWMALLDELQGMGLEKEAFGPREARKVLQLAKKKVLKVPRLQQTATRAAEAGLAGKPVNLSIAEQSLLHGGGAPIAIHKTAPKSLRRAAATGGVTMPVTPEAIQGTERLSGKILTAKGGDPTAAIRRHPALEEAVSGPISRMTPQQRMMHNAAIMRHEMAEQAIRGPKTKELTPFRMATGHMGAEAPLTDVNVLATLPKGSAPVREAMQAYRPVESHLLERATRGVGGREGMQFGTQRLSRHAKKRVGKRMEEMASEDLKAALAGPDGDAIREQFKAMGIGRISGIGKISAAPQAVVERERKRLVRKAGPAVGALLGAGVGALRGAKKGRLLANIVGGLGTGATLGWLPDIVASAGEAGKRYQRKVL
jgi:hypothetical protein